MSYNAQRSALSGIIAPVPITSRRLGRESRRYMGECRSRGQFYGIRTGVGATGKRSGSMKNSGNQFARYRFGLRLLVKHPELNLSHLTAKLGLKPDICWLAGAPRISISGEAPRGVYKSSVWSHTEEVINSRTFFHSVNKLAHDLGRHKSVLLRIVKSGGTIELIVELPGELSALCVNLGIEVFPEFRPPEVIV